MITLSSWHLLLCFR